jgi:arabinofuranosyltransferase
VRGEYNVVEKNRELGLWLRDNAPADTVVATGIAGALPFYSGLHVIDTLGLNDLHIAHLEVAEMGAGIAGAEKTDVPYVLDQRPTYIPYSTSGTFQGYPRFKAEYELVEVRGPEGRAIKLYRRKDAAR